MRVITPTTTAGTLCAPAADVPTAAGVLRILRGPAGPLVLNEAVPGVRETVDNMLEARGYRTDDGLTVIVSRDQTPHGSLLHVSISRRDRYPTWGEIKAIREAFYDADVDVMMVMPKKADYVNLHKNCFHLWQTPASWGLR